MKKLQGKVAIVTGASKGIGASIAKHLAEAGAAVVVNYATSKEGAANVVAEITKNGGKAIPVQGDMSKPADIKRLFAESKKAFGQVNILVNNAGIYRFSPLEEISRENFYEMFDLNVLGLLLASQEAAKNFGPNGGSIINISSIASVGSLPNSSVYSATKASVDAITRILSQELGPKKIRVNAINPGLVETEGVQNMVGLDTHAMKESVEKQSALGRVGQPNDIAPAVVFFASDDASWITGETLFISGGFKG